MIEITEYLKQRIENDELLKDFQNDLGIIVIENSLEFKTSSILEKIKGELKETLAPKSELFLLAHLLYRTGYIKLPSPLKIKANIISDDTVYIPKNTEFTDGENIFLLENNLQLQADTLTEMKLQCAEIFKKTVTIDSGNLFFYIPLNVKYNELANVKLFYNKQELKYSQNFVDFFAEWSYEVFEDGFVKVVVKLKNDYSNNLQIGNDLEIEIYTLKARKDAPDNLAIIENGYNTVVSDIILTENYNQGLTLQDMKDIVKYGRGNIGDIITNEDYYQMILKHLKGDLKVLKIWQEKEEAEETVTDIFNINKVFVCYVDKDDNVRNATIDEIITAGIEKYIYGKEVVIRDTNLIDLNVTIDININAGYDNTIKTEIREQLTGYYDDIKNKIDVDTIYAQVFRILDDYFKKEPFKLKVLLSDKGDYRNRKVYRLLDNSISIMINGTLL